MLQLTTHNKCSAFLWLWACVCTGAIMTALLLSGSRAPDALVRQAPTLRRAACRHDCRSLATSRNLHHTQLIRDALNVATDIRSAWAQRDGTKPTAVLLLSNIKYRARFDEMINTWSHFARQEALVMAALDNATSAYFQSKGIKTLDVFPERISGHRSIAEAVMRAKLEIPYAFLLHGLRVVMVEMDIYCRHNPLALDKGTDEILVSSHAGGEDEVNVGFWIAYPTCRVVDSFRRMQAWVTSPNRQGAFCTNAFDQKLMHFAWLGTGKLSKDNPLSCRTFPQRDQIFDPRFHDPVAVKRIRTEDIMHWPIGNASDPMCVHIWSGSGPPVKQMKFGYRQGWFPRRSEKDAHAALALLQDVDESDT